MCVFVFLFSTAEGAVRRPVGWLGGDITVFKGPGSAGCASWGGVVGRPIQEERPHLFQVQLIFTPSSPGPLWLSHSVVDLGEGPLSAATAPALGQLSHRALAVSLQLAQVLVEDLCRAQC